MATKAPGPTIDHIIILLPYADLTSPPAWLSDNFFISPGGRHGDDKTENRLIIFRDGSYLELIAFINDDPEKRRGHWWDKAYGVVDYSLGPESNSLNHGALNERLARSGTGISYTTPQAGGRRRPDGVEMQWEVTFPSGAERGTVPFWCQDVTPRERRVPVTETNTTHPCGALGVGGVQVAVRRADEVARIDAALAAIVDAARGRAGQYDLDAPKPVEGLKRPFVTVREASLDADDEAESQRTLVLQVKSRHVPDDIVQKVGGGTILIRFEQT